MTDCAGIDGTTSFAAAPCRPAEQGRLTAGVLAAYGGPSVPLSAVAIPLLAYIPTFYAARVGLPLAMVGAIFLIVRLADIAADPLIGMLMDRGSSRLGRFRPWLAAGAIPLVIGILLLFHPLPGSGPLFLAGSLAMVYGSYSVCYLAHLSWGTTLSSDYAVRSRIFGWWQAGTLTGSILVLATPILAEGAFGATHDQGIAAMGWLIAILLPLTVLPALFIVHEPRTPAHRSGSHVKDYFLLMIQPTIARLLVVDLVIGVAIGMNSALFFFYFGAVKGMSPLATTVLLFLNLCGSLCGAPFWSYMTGRIGKHRAAAWAFAFYALSLIAIAVMPGASLAMGCLVLFLAGITLSAGPMLLRSMMADAGDEELLRSGHDRTGLLSALFSGTNKLGLALAPGLSFMGLGLAGFNAAGGNATSALHMLTALYILAPALLGGVAAWGVLGHRLTAERHADIRRQLAELA